MDFIFAHSLSHTNQNEWLEDGWMFLFFLTAAKDTRFTSIIPLGNMFPTLFHPCVSSLYHGSLVLNDSKASAEVKLTISIVSSVQLNHIACSVMTCRTVQSVI